MRNLPQDIYPQGLHSAGTSLPVSLASWSFAFFQEMQLNHHIWSVQAASQGEMAKSLWVRIKGRAGTGDIIVGVC